MANMLQSKLQTSDIAKSIFANYQADYVDYVKDGNTII